MQSWTTRRNIVDGTVRSTATSPSVWTRLLGPATRNSTSHGVGRSRAFRIWMVLSRQRRTPHSRLLLVGWWFSCRQISLTDISVGGACQKVAGVLGSTLIHSQRCLSCRWSALARCPVWLSTPGHTLVCTVIPKSRVLRPIFARARSGVIRIEWRPTPLDTHRRDNRYSRLRRGG